MAQATSIEWTDFSVNPFRAADEHGHKGHYCEKISPGCTNCYASKMQVRFQMPVYQKNKQEGVEVYFDRNVLREVLKRKKPTKYFWWDMTDAFLDCYPDEWLDECFAIMALTPHHTHQVLTKRPERMRDYFHKHFTRHRMAVKAKLYSGKENKGCSGITLECDPDVCNIEFPLKNVWLGISAENQKTFDERIGLLLDTPAHIRWISAEPLLGPIDMRSRIPSGACMSLAKAGQSNLARAIYIARCEIGFHWVVIGGESGSKARAFSTDDAARILEECRDAGIGVFVKQLGRRPFRLVPSLGVRNIELSTLKGNIISEWPEFLQVREYPGEVSA